MCLGQSSVHIVWPYDSSMTKFARKVAVVAGIGAYASSPLRNPASDARIVQQALIDTAGFAPDNVYECIDPLSSCQHLRLALKKLRNKAHPGGLAVFYFAGHGMMCIDNLYLLGREFDGQDYDHDVAGVSLADVTTAMQGYDTGIILLDACRCAATANTSNTEGRSVKFLGQDDSSSNGLGALRDALAGSRAGACRRAKILVAYACHLGGKASDAGGDNVDHAVFTTCLVEELFGAKPVLAAVDEANKKVRLQTNYQQEPTAETANPVHFMSFGLGKAVLEIEAGLGEVQPHVLLSAADSGHAAGEQQSAPRPTATSDQEALRQGAASGDQALNDLVISQEAQEVVKVEQLRQLKARRGDVSKSWSWRPWKREVYVVNMTTHELLAYVAPEWARLFLGQDSAVKHISVSQQVCLQPWERKAFTIEGSHAYLTVADTAEQKLYIEKYVLQKGDTVTIWDTADTC